MPKITKLDAARRQLVTAIRLFFMAGDPVSVFSLASNAWEIVDAMCTLANIGSLSRETQDHLPDGKKLRRDYINEPYRNFFKHADRDPYGSVDFHELDAEAVMFLAVENYLRLRKGGPAEFQVYQLWYLALHPLDIAVDEADYVTTNR